MDNIKSVSVIGGGTMGNGIAQVFAVGGFEVVLCDIADSALQRAVATIEKNLERMAAREKISGEVRTQALARLRCSTRLAEAARAQLVVEAASESWDVKAKLFKELDRLSPPETILATNTSSLSITKLAAVTGRPGQVIGMHFMNPAPVMQLVEVIRALQTSEAVFETVQALARRLGKTPVSVKNSPAFVANRILLPMINEAICALHEGLASAEDIDTVMKLGANHPQGPLALADMIGLDVCLSVLQVLYEGFNDPKYRPCPLLKEMVDAGYLGRKSGRGFYQY